MPVMGKLCILAVLSLLVGCDKPVGTTDPAIDKAVVMHPLPGKSVSSGYFDITNNSDRELTLTGASSAATSSIEFHKIIRDGDRVKMQRQPQVTIPPGVKVNFARGGLHLMLFGVTELTEATLSIQLTTTSHGPIQATFQVERW